MHKVKIDHEQKTIKLDCSGEMDVALFNKEGQNFELQHEFGKWQIEGILKINKVVPTKPLNLDNLPKFQDLIEDMFKFVESHIGLDKIISISAFPMLGVDNDYYYFSSEALKFYNENGVNTSFNQKQISNSDIFDDVIISSHNRFKNLTQSIRYRRGKNIKIKMPIYKDNDSNKDTLQKDFNEKNFIELDAEGYGSGNCCFQATLGCQTLNDALFTYDQLIPLTPILVKYF